MVERQLGKQAGGALLGSYRGPACEGRAGVEWLEGYPAEGGPAGMNQRDGSSTLP